MVYFLPLQQYCAKNNIFYLFQTKANSFAEAEKAVVRSKSFCTRICQRTKGSSSGSRLCPK